MQSALPCHYVILVACIAVRPTPAAESARITFCRRHSGLIELHPNWRHLLGDNVVDQVVCLKPVLCNINGDFYTTIIHLCLNGSIRFQLDCLLDEGLAFVQAGVPLCSNDVTHHSCVNFKCGVADVTMGFPLISGP